MNSKPISRVENIEKFIFYGYTENGSDLREKIIFDIGFGCLLLIAFLWFGFAEITTEDRSIFSVTLGGVVSAYPHNIVALTVVLISILFANLRNKILINKLEAYTHENLKDFSGFYRNFSVGIVGIYMIFSRSIPGNRTPMFFFYLALCATASMIIYTSTRLYRLYLLHKYQNEFTDPRLQKYKTTTEKGECD